MIKTNKSSGAWATRNSQNTRMLAYWNGAWVVTMAIATFGPIFLWDSASALTIILIIVNLLVGIGMIVANKRHLQGLDEMHQKIQYQAMALALGVGLVVGLSYSLLDTTNYIAADAEISHLVIVMALTYFIATLIGHRRYR